MPAWLLKNNKDVSAELKEKISSTNLFSSHVFIPSSGTLSHGELKIIALSKKALLCSAIEVNKHLQITKKDRLLSILPVYHVADLAVKVRADASQACLVTGKDFQKWSAKNFLTLLKKEKISVTSVVPAQIFDLVSNNLTSPKHLRLVLVGGSALSVELCYRAMSLGWPVVPTYGMTELCSQVATASLQDLKKIQKLFLNSVSDNHNNINHNKNNRNNDQNNRNNEQNNIKKEIQTYVTSWKILPHINAKLQKGDLYLQSPSLLSAEFILKKGNLIKEKHYKPEEWFLTGDKVSLNKEVINFKNKSLERLKIKSKLVLLEDLNFLLEQLNLSNHLNLNDVYLFPEEHIRDGHRLVLITNFANIFLKKISTLVELFNAKVQIHEHIRYIYYFSDIPKTELGKLKLESIKKWIKFV